MHRVRNCPLTRTTNHALRQVSRFSAYHTPIAGRSLSTQSGRGRTTRDWLPVSLIVAASEQTETAESSAREEYPKGIEPRP